jgi:hypothetical protein
MSFPSPPPDGKINFAGMVGAKRRRMRSGGNVSTLTNNSPKGAEGGGPSSFPASLDTSGMMDDEKTAQTSKCKGATTIPIFLKSKTNRRKRM